MSDKTQFYLSTNFGDSQTIPHTKHLELQIRELSDMHKYPLRQYALFFFNFTSDHIKTKGLNGILFIKHFGEQKLSKTAYQKAGTKHSKFATCHDEQVFQVWPLTLFE